MSFLVVDCPNSKLDEWLWVDCQVSSFLIKTSQVFGGEVDAKALHSRYGMECLISGRFGEGF